MFNPELDLVVLYEHSEWQKPLFKELDKRDIQYQTVDLKKNSFIDDIFVSIPNARLYFNQASPSAYTRGNDRAVPFNIVLMEYLESQGKKIVNGSKAFRFELSKMTQIAVMQKLEIPYPKTIAFNDVQSLEKRVKSSNFPFPAILKPNQGGSGARMFHAQSIGAIRNLLDSQPDLWLPDNMFLLQEYLNPKSESEGIIRLEYLGGKLLYAMRVVSNGSFNLCPSDYCNPINEINFDLNQNEKKDLVKFFPYPEVPVEMVKIGERIMEAGELDIGAIEYLKTADDRKVVYDINANSNLRTPIGEYFGFDPFKRVVDYLEEQLMTLDPSILTLNN